MAVDFHGRDFRIIQIGGFYDVACRKHQIHDPHVFRKLISAGLRDGTLDGNGFSVHVLVHGMNDDFIFVLQCDIIRRLSGHCFLQIKMDDRILLLIIDADHFRLD